MAIKPAAAGAAAAFQLPLKHRGAANKVDLVVIGGALWAYDPKDGTIVNVEAMSEKIDAVEAGKP